MNSAYGKTIMKHIKITNEYIPNELITEYFDKKYNLFEAIYSVDTDEQFMIKIRKGTVKQVRKCLLDSQILSMSKRIMNEVMYITEDIGIQVYYYDADSLHILKVA